MTKSIQKLKNPVDEIKCRSTLKALSILRGANKRPGVYKHNVYGLIIRIHWKVDDGSIYFDYHARSKKIAKSSEINKKSAWVQMQDHADIIEYMDNVSSASNWATEKQTRFILYLCKELNQEVNEEVFKDKHSASIEIDRLLKMKEGSKPENTPLHNNTNTSFALSSTYKH